MVLGTATENIPLRKFWKHARERQQKHIAPKPLTIYQLKTFYPPEVTPDRQNRPSRWGAVSFLLISGEPVLIDSAILYTVRMMKWSFTKTRFTRVAVAVIFFSSFKVGKNWFPDVCRMTHENSRKVTKIPENSLYSLYGIRVAVAVIFIGFTKVVTIDFPMLSNKVLRERLQLTWVSFYLTNLSPVVQSRFFSKLLSVRH